MSRLLKYLHPEIQTEENIEIIKSLPEDYDTPPNIEPQNIFTKKFLGQNKEYKWVNECSFVLVSKVDRSDIYQDTEFFVTPTLDAFFDKLYNEAKVLDKDIFSDFTKKTKYLGCDTETNTLNTNIRFVGGKLESKVFLAGLCFATSGNLGYYVPIRNNEIDGVPNWDYETEVKPFLQKVIDSFYTVWHNAKYDLSVLRNNGIVLNDDFCCTELSSKITSKWEYEPYQLGNGLKNNAKHYLKRHMVELNELLGKNEVINFNRLASVDSVLYASSDAMNTLLIFEMYSNPKFERNPFIHQSLPLRITLKSIRRAISKVSSGIPINYSQMKTTFMTLLRRQIILEDRFASKYASNVLTSDEKVGIFLGTFIKSQYPDTEDKFNTLMTSLFGMEIKTVTLKSGIAKTTYNCPDNVLQELSVNLDKLTFLNNDRKLAIREIIQFISNYRSLQHEIGIYVGVMRSIRYDDRGYAYYDYDLRIDGTDTGRFSNSKGSGLNRVIISVTDVTRKVSTKFVGGDGNASAINSQGINADSLRLSECKKILSLSKELAEKYKDLDEKVNMRFLALIMKEKVK